MYFNNEERAKNTSRLFVIDIEHLQEDYTLQVGYNGALTLGKGALYRTQVRLPPLPTVPLACAHTRQSQLGLSMVASGKLRFHIGARVGSLASVPLLWHEHTSAKCTEATELSCT